MIDLDVLSQRYGVMPSKIIKSKIDDYEFDLLVCSKSIEYENKMNKKSQAWQKKKLR